VGYNSVADIMGQSSFV